MRTAEPGLALLVLNTVKGVVHGGRRYRPVTCGGRSPVRGVCVAIAILLLASACSPDPAERGDDAPVPSEAVLRGMLEDAAAASLSGLHHAAMYGGRVMPGDTEDNVPLTAMLWILPVRSTEKSSVTWLVEEDALDPLRLVEELQAHALTDEGRRVSVLHRDLLQGVTFQADGPRLHGTVSFAVPGFLKGVADFEARHGVDGWEVVEFRMEEEGFATVKTAEAEGRWVVRALEPIPSR